MLVLLGSLAWAFYQEIPGVAQMLLLTFIVAAVATLLLVIVEAIFKPAENKPADDQYWRVSPMPGQPDLWSETIYPIGRIITGFIVFIASWLYCIATYGFLFGVGLGWLPSIIVAVIAGYLWPLIVIAIVALIVLISK